MQGITLETTQNFKKALEKLVSVTSLSETMRKFQEHLSAELNQLSPSNTPNPTLIIRIQELIQKLGIAINESEAESVDESSFALYWCPITSKELFGTTGENETFYEEHILCKNCKTIFHFSYARKSKLKFKLSLPVRHEDFCCQACWSSCK